MQDESKNNHNTDEAEIWIYTDGSGKGRKAGVGAVLCRGNNVPKILHFHLGSLQPHTIYEAEAAGMLLGAYLSEEETNFKLAGIYIDNQVVIQMISILQPQPVHYLIDVFVRKLTCILHTLTARHIKVNWIFGYDKVGGNKMVDQVAKKIAPEKQVW